MNIHPRELELWNEVICKKKGRKSINNGKTAHPTSARSLIKWKVAENYNSFFVVDIFERS